MILYSFIISLCVVAVEILFRLGINFWTQWYLWVPFAFLAHFFASKAFTTSETFLLAVVTIMSFNLALRVGAAFLLHERPNSITIGLLIIVALGNILLHAK